LGILVLSQVANGVWLPIVLIFMILLINRRDLMGDQVNGRTSISSPGSRASP